MNNWEILQNELKHYGISTSNNICYIKTNGKPKKQGIVKTLVEIEAFIHENIKKLEKIWTTIVHVLGKYNDNVELYDPKYYKLFVFSLEDLVVFLNMFEDKEESCNIINRALNRDINSFSIDQIKDIVDLKICLDWSFTFITRLLYIKKLLSLVSMGEKRILKYKIVVARGISGPWANLDLPIFERAFPFDADDFPLRTKQKQKQRRYRQGFEAYHSPGVAQGYYWRELKNEPFLWSDKATESPYPSRNTLMNWG